LASYVTLSAQSPAPILSFGHQEWSTENGLPQNSVHQILQTANGYLWIATEGGIARFNGVAFTPFNQQSSKAFSSDDTCCLAQDASGSLWIGTADGLLRSTANTPATFHRYSTADGLPSATILSLTTSSDGAVVALTPDGVVRFNGTRFQPLAAAPPNASAIARAPDGSLWIASPGGIVHTQQSGSAILPNPSTESIEAFAILPGNTTLLRTRTTLTLIHDSVHRSFTAGHDLPGTRIASALLDSRGTLWIGTNQGLAFLPSAESSATTAPHLEPQIGSNSVLSLYEDREGNIWVGTEATGIHILRQQSFHSPPQFSDRVVTTLAETTTGTMAVGTNGDGLDLQHVAASQPNPQLEHLSTRNGLLSDVILALAPAPNGALWVGTPDGLNSILNGRVQAYTSADGLPDDLIRSLLVDPDNSVWVGTRRGLAHFTQHTVTTLTHADGLPSDLIGALLRSSAPPPPESSTPDLWIGTLDGLARLRNHHITTFTTRDGLAGNIITSLLEDSSHTLWIGTDGNGLTYLSADRFVSIHATNLPTSIQSILDDHRGHLWLGSARGITRVAISDLLACGPSPSCSPSVVNFGQSDGLTTSETSSIGHPSAIRTASGSLWFATRKGVAIADPAHLHEDLVPPPVLIERFTVDDVDSPLSTSEVTISPGHSRFTFDYIGLSFSAPSKVRYRYRLEGFDPAWTEAGSRRIAYYTNLSPGHYRFRVQAANPDGVWNDTGAAVAFYLSPPFYRRLWFLLLAALLIAALGIALYRLRMHRLQARLEAQYNAILAERNRIAREIHDTLAQGFAGVSVQLELTSHLLTHAGVAAAQQQLDQTRLLVRQGLEDARRSIWELRAATAQDTLPTRLSRLVEQIVGATHAATVNIGGTYRPLDSAFESEVLRIAQEALTNIVRHAAASSVTVQLRYDATSLHLVITDNGKGFDPHFDALLQQGHFGLQGMRERAAQISGQIALESSPGNGTTLTLEAPIRPAKGTNV
jgi:signal transduction histidine kinase/ligand-binding sensor domain-containing protein